MLDRQLLKPSIPCESNTETLIALWLFPRNLPLKEISNIERVSAEKLTRKRAEEFFFSRSYTREAISTLFNVPPLSIPLSANPGKPPTLDNGWGYVSISHCVDALLVGWSIKEIGVDIERTDRVFEYKKIVNRFFAKEEILHIESLNIKEQNLITLKKWVTKEAAIKWSKGKLVRDLERWIPNNSKSDRILVNNKIKKKVSIYQQNIFEWEVGIACDETCNIEPMVCIN